jgi:hypothetical protein
MKKVWIILILFWKFNLINLKILEIECTISILAEKIFSTENEWSIQLKALGDKSESDLFLNKFCLFQIKQGFTTSTAIACFIHRFHLFINEIGKVLKLN